jgi:hypothetical protein
VQDANILHLSGDRVKEVIPYFLAQVPDGIELSAETGNFFFE